MKHFYISCILIILIACMLVVSQEIQTFVNSHLFEYNMEVVEVKLSPIHLFQVRSTVDILIRYKHNYKIIPLELSGIYFIHSTHMLISGEVVEEIGAWKVLCSNIKEN